MLRKTKDRTLGTPSLYLKNQTMFHLLGKTVCCWFYQIGIACCFIIKCKPTKISHIYPKIMIQIFPKQGRVEILALNVTIIKHTFISKTLKYWYRKTRQRYRRVERGDMKQSRWEQKIEDSIYSIYNIIYKPTAQADRKHLYPQVLDLRKSSLPAPLQQQPSLIPYVIFIWLRAFR